MPTDPHTLEFRTILAQSSVTLDGHQAQILEHSIPDAFAEVVDLNDGRLEFFGWNVVHAAVHRKQGKLMSADQPPIVLPGSPDQAP